MHPRLNAVPVVLADGQQLQHIAHFPAEGDILGAHLRDALAVYVLYLHPAVERQRSRDAQLVGRVVSLHVRRGVRLRQAQPLRVLQHVLILRAFRRHPGQDVVRRPVHDAHHLLDVVRDQRALDRVDDRDRAAHARLVVQARAGFPGHRAQLVKVQAQGHLVRRHDALAVLQRAQHHRGRRLLPAQEFADDLDFRILKDIVLIGRQHLVRHFLAAVDLHVQHQRLLDPQLHARALLHLAAEFADQVPYAASDISQAKQTQHYFFHCFSTSVRFLS